MLAEVTQYKHIFFATLMITTESPFYSPNN